MKRPSLYGSRWRIVSNDGASLGEGGQSHVFRVVDTQSVFEGEYALKRVKNPQRSERFRGEVEAIKRLNHTNIIRLVDHSALDDTTGADDKQYLVMPIAAAGDLGRPDRYSLYSGLLDPVLAVAKQLASALSTAHAANVIHRDVKPENILFTGNGHEVWLTDFGICLLREAERATQPQEAVGPQVYMAPELEGGGELEVTPAADVYSLGKVIYFMLSGGRILPRERLDEPQYASVFQGGQRFSLLQMLLRRMICVLSGRIKTMDEVVQELTKIEEWDRRARLLPVSEAGLANLDSLRKKASEKQKIAAENASAREQEEMNRSSITETFGAWLRGELETFGAAITSEELPIKVRDAVPPMSGQLVVQVDHSSAFRSLHGIELCIEEIGESLTRGHLLQFYLCERLQGLVSVGRDVAARPVRDLSLALIPFYRQTNGHQHPKMSAMMGYLTSQKTLSGLVGQVNLPHLRGPRGAVNFSRPMRVTQSFNRNLSHLIEFKASEWPSNVEVVHACVTEAIDLFTSYLKEGARSVGP